MTDSILWVGSAIEMNDAITEAAESGRRSVVVFTAPLTCRPCKSFEPFFKRAADNADDIVFVAVDLDLPGNEWATLDYGVRSVPTAWRFDEEGLNKYPVKVPQSALAFLSDIRR